MVGANVHMCAAKKCYNSRINHPSKGFFGFPQNVQLCKTWLENCGRDDLDVATIYKSNGYYKLCADHFDTNCFTDRTKTLLKRNMNPVPTIFINNIGNLLPYGSQKNTVDIDLPSEIPLELGNTSSLHKHVVNTTETLVESEHPPISYYSSQIMKEGDYSPGNISKALLNLKPETELYQISELCRFCMNKALQNFIQIFSDTVEGKEIREICATVMPNKIEIFDGLPHRICQTCIKDLKTCHKLMEQFKSADRYLRAIAKYSLFIENEDDCGSTCIEKEEHGILVGNLKPIPKSAMVMQLKNFQVALEESENFLEEMSDKTRSPIENTASVQDKSKGIADTVLERADTFMGVETPSNVNESVIIDTVNDDVLTLPSPSPQFEIITDDHNILQDTVEMECRNVVIPSKEIGSQQSLFSKNTLETSKRCQYISKQNMKQEYFKYKRRKSIPEHINNNSTKDNSQNVYHVGSKLKVNKFSQIESYKCVECSKIFASFVLLEEHNLHYHQRFALKMSYMCIFCKMKFENSTLLVKHLTIEHKNKISFLKSKAKEEFNNNTEIEHIPKKRNGDVKCSTAEQHLSTINDKVAEGTIYGKELQDVHCTRIHEINHEQECTVICWICGLVLNTKDSLQKHLQFHNDQTNTNDINSKAVKMSDLPSNFSQLHKPKCQDKKLFCEYCSKSFLCEQALKKHVITHSTIKPFKCGFCGKGFTHKHTFQNHEKKRKILAGVCPKFNKIKIPFKLKEMPTLECDICGRKFIKSTSVERHRKYHFCSGNTEIIQKLLDEPEVHKCNICGQYLFSKISLQWHMRIHTGASKPFKCEFCGKCYASSQQMITHERFHTGEKPFKCNYCNKGFFTKKNLQLHEMVHTADKSHVCQICCKTFYTQKHLLEHTLLHVQFINKAADNYLCNICGKQFVTKGGHQDHMNQVHRDVEEDKLDQGLENEFEFLNVNNQG